MDKTTLVSVDAERGAEIVKALDERGLKVKVALWAWLDEYEDWRLILAPPQLDKLDLRQAYGKVNDVLAAAGFTVYNSPTKMIFRMSDFFIRQLRRRFSKVARVEGMRLGGQLIGDRWIEDAYVYRIS